jgi:hypothetical protein
MPVLSRRIRAFSSAVRSEVSVDVHPGVARQFLLDLGVALPEPVILA